MNPLRPSRITGSWSPIRINASPVSRKTTTFHTAPPSSREVGDMIVGLNRPT